MSLVRWFQSKLWKGNKTVTIFDEFEWLRHQHHGGRCCGMIHIHNFPPFSYLNEKQKAQITPENVKKHIHKCVLASYGKRRAWTLKCDLPSAKWNSLVEAVLTDSQLDGGWRPILAEAGFKEVSRFFNSNSGNYCTVLHYQPTPDSRVRDLFPYRVEE